MEDARMGIVSDGYAVGLAVVCNGVYARHLATAHRVDAQLVVGAVGRAFYMAVGSRQSALHPAVLAVDIVYYLLGKSYRRAARSVELMHVVSLLHCNRILRKSVHYLCQIAVDGREYGHAYTEVRGPEEGLSALGAHLSDIVAVVFHPSRRARHHLDVVRKGPEIVAVGGSRIGELDGNISRGKGLAVEVLLVVDVDYTYNLVATAKGYLLNHLAHLAIADKSYFHN